MTDNIKNTLDHLTKFSEPELWLGKPILDNRLEEFEKTIGYKLPTDFKIILKKYNGFSLMSTEVNGIGSELRDSSLDRLYHIEHEEVENPMPKEFLPFSPDGQGNHYCLDLSRLENEICPVVFWQHDYEYPDLGEVETCNDSFTVWIENVMIT